MKTNTNKEKTTTEISHPGNKKSSTIKTKTKQLYYSMITCSFSYQMHLRILLMLLRISFVYTYTVAYILFSSFISSRQKNLLQLVWIEYWAHGVEWHVMDRWRDQRFSLKKTHLIVSFSQMEAMAKTSCCGHVMCIIFFKPTQSEYTATKLKHFPCQKVKQS